MVQAKPKTATKKLTVTFQGEDRLPQFKFDGDWTGHDAGMVLRHTRREYLRHQQAIRRQAEATVPKNPSEPKETK